MDLNDTPRKRPVNPRRRRRSKLRVFKETYLPVILVVLVLVMVVAFFANSLKKSKQEQDAALKESLAAVQSSEEARQKYQAEASGLIAHADALAASYDYDQAIAMVDSFSGNFYDFDDLIAARDRYVLAKESIVVWSDPAKVPHLSCNVLVYDPAKAYADPENKGVFKKNFITVSEFSAILEQLYKKGYVLVSMEDVVNTTENADGTVSYTAGEIRLPPGKRPLMLTQTHVNYYGYMTDGDGDGLADAGGSGFASRLVVDETGAVTCEMITKEGTTTGAYDMVPILDAFIKEHPDFSYRGAKAIIAVTGYEGIFGYRIDPALKKTEGGSFHKKQVEGATAVAQALRDSGYTLACHTFGNQSYGSINADKLQGDLDKWMDTIAPVMGQTDVLVFARNSDIAGKEAYSGAKYTVLKNAGFRYFYGFCDGSTPWVQLDANYVRQGRIVITGTALTQTPEIFSDFFNAETVLDSHR